MSNWELFQQTMEQVEKTTEEQLDRELNEYLDSQSPKIWESSNVDRG